MTPPAPLDPPEPVAPAPAVAPPLFEEPPKPVTPPLDVVPPALDIPPEPGSVEVLVEVSVPGGRARAQAPEPRISPSAQAARSSLVPTGITPERKMSGPGTTVI
jgi:hypothetical protein